MTAKSIFLAAFGSLLPFDPLNESRMYNYLKGSSAVYVSVGHRPALVEYHEMMLQLQAEQRRQLLPAGDYDPTGSK